MLCCAGFPGLPPRRAPSHAGGGFSRPRETEQERSKRLGLKPDKPKPWRFAPEPRERGAAGKAPAGAPKPVGAPRTDSALRSRCRETEAARLIRLGKENVALYDNSLGEWVTDTALPMETG